MERFLSLISEYGTADKDTVFEGRQLMVNVTPKK
jgi:hypothetical protein